MEYISIQIIVASLWILAFYNHRVTSANADTGTGRIGEILQFWQPDPVFQTTSPVIKRRNKINEHFKFSYDKDSKHESTRFTPVGLKEANDTREIRKFRRAVLVKKFPLIKPPKKTDKKRKHATTEMVQKQKEKDEEYDEYENNFVLTVYELDKQFKKLLSEYANVNVTSEVLGRTASYNDILLLKIAGTAPSQYFRTNENMYVRELPEKKIVFIVHALSVMGLDKLHSLTVEKYLKKLLSFYLAHMDKFDIFLMPMANPDGYVQVKRDSFWNKNTSPQPACSGVALDRNFDVAWNSSRQTSSCSHHYPGPRPFSEPESAAVGDIFHKYSHKIIAYFHVHAGQYDISVFKGDAILYPRGFTDIQTSDDDKYIDLKGEIDEAMRNANFKTFSFTVDTLYSWYGKISGSSVDYAAEVYGIPYAMELVMQLYQDPFLLQIGKMRLLDISELEYDALTEVWGRVINVTFSNIWRKASGIEQDSEK